MSAYPPASIAPLSSEGGAPSRSRGELLKAPLLTAAGGLAGAAALHVRDPHQTGSWGFCPFHLLTGLDCPGCGGLRAVNDLSNGDVVAAVGSNALAVLFMAVMVVLWVRWLVLRARGRDVPLIQISLRTGMILLATAFALNAFRWTPWGAWFASAS